MQISASFSICAAALIASQMMAADPPQQGTVSVGGALRELIEADWVERDRQFEAARQGPKPISGVADDRVTTAEDAAGGCDGIKNGRFGFHVASGETDPWWQVDLGGSHRLDRVVVYNRTQGNAAPRTRSLRILTAADAASPKFQLVYQHNGETFYGVHEKRPLNVSFRGQNVEARIVRLQVLGRCSLALDEVEIYPADAPSKNIALGKPADQKSTGPSSARSPRAQEVAAAKLAPPAPATFSLAHARDVVRRARELAARLRPQADPTRLEPLVRRAASLDERLARLEAGGGAPEETRRAHYFEACSLARQIAFCNPQLDFDKILFVKRHPAGGLYHMVHQFYGFCATPGGGLFFLRHPFSDDPKLVDVLAHSRVAKGRLAGRELKPGSFLSPELSYDGETILFAYTECGSQGIEWSPRASYHVFRVNEDGSGLAQLTDGRWNEFDPCFLPNGRIAFISERRGGYLRCGGSAPPYDSPTYTLHSMADDGGDIECLSFHETQEWQPSVGHDGMIVYTRWDYVDRDTNIAHHLWTCFPDGRDPRSFHGNYPLRRESRPWMEMDIRAVPGSHRYVATAAAHHGHAFGSLVLIDPRVPDDGAMSQLTRLTPDVPFPESEGAKSLIRRRMAYATAWPLSEDDYLCAYDSEAKNHGIYWIDRFGNRELLYRDPEIACLSPIPVRPRPKPPALPDQTLPIAATSNGLSDAGSRTTVAVMNVYDSDFQWPAGSKITALRVIQVLPKSTPPSNQPRIGAGNQTNARAVLGTAPVEADGSAFFEVPAGKAVYFQALNEQGMAVQSMRSATYLHPGEHLACRGCHEPKHRAAATARVVPVALRRPPSKMQPEADGSNPFSFVRLVQPVLNRHCVGCHQEKKAVDLTGAVDGKYGWSQSYTNLAGKYGFYFHVNNGTINSGVHGGSRTVPGQFGARAAPLLNYLDQRHYGVNLSAQDFHRVTLWLDCNSEFYGAYEGTTAQALGKIIHPTLD